MLLRRLHVLSCVQLFLVLVVCAVTSRAQTTSFTYQGKLSDGGGPATSVYDFQFTVWDALSGGAQQPQPSPVTVTKTNVAVSGGIFTVQLDFGASAFPGADRYLEIGVRPTGGGGFTILSPRQPITPTPYAMRSASAASADTATSATNAANATSAQNALQLGGIAANQFVQTNDSRLSDARPPTAGSSLYIQNASSQQTSSSFNISGNGVVGSSLGVGISAPVYRLHVVQNVANLYAAHIQTSGLTTGSSFGLAVSAGTDANDASFNARNQSGTSMFLVRGDGRVGIGTTSPLGHLQVSASSTASTSFVLENLFGVQSRQLILSNYGSLGGGLYWPGLDSASTSSLLGPNLFVLRSTGGLVFSGSSTAEHMRIDTSGNVGIGTNAPTARLQVNGDIVGAGRIRLGTTAQQNSAKLSVQGGNDFFGVYAVNGNGSGDINFPPATGVWGDSDINYGVFGTSHSGVGVAGFSSSGPGLVVQSETGNIVNGFNRLDPVFHITNNGTYVGGGDFAEALPVRGDISAYEPGDVLVASTKAPGKVEKAGRPYDRRVAGVYSTRPGMLGADKNGASRVDADDAPVAIVGIVPTKVSAMNGPIRVGDLLTTSSTPGYAMRCRNRVKCVGAIVGKALEPMSAGNRVIKVLVMLR
jgi:hypothetical protein